MYEASKQQVNIKLVTPTSTDNRMYEASKQQVNNSLDHLNRIPLHNASCRVQPSPLNILD